MRIFFLFLFFSMLEPADSGEGQRTEDKLNAEDLQPYGRTILHDKEGLELIGSAVHFGFTFEGESCKIYASIPDGQDHNYLQYELDGVYQKRLKVLRGADNSLSIAATKSGKHVVWVYKATEAQTGPIFIQKVEGKNIKSITPSSSPLIEFIGNSITCGAAADTSDLPCGQGLYHDHHNAYYAYGPRVARALGANYILSSVSGIGIYRNWNSDGPTMPEVYESARFQKDSNEVWNFARYSPKVVSIALGTNDLSFGDGSKQRLPFDSAGFISHYVQFIARIKIHYPLAQIALLSSPIITGTNRVLLQNCLNTIKQVTDTLYPNAKPVALYFFKPMHARGCSGHPSLEDHRIMAAELQPFFQQFLH